MASGLSYLTVIALVLQSGCATIVVPPTPSQEVRDNLGVVAIVPAQYAPISNFLIHWRHKEGATISQSALTAGSGTAATVAVAAIAAPIAIPVIVFSGVVATGVMTLREALVTSKGTVSAKTAAEIESSISKAVAALDVQSALATRLSNIMKSDPHIRVAAVSASGPDKPEARPDYAQLRKARVDTVIEIAINEIGFDGCISKNWECRTPHVLYFFMRAQARLVRVVDGTALFEWPVEYKSGNRELTNWLADGGQLLGEEFEQAYRVIAEKIYDKSFLITPIELPFVSNAWESSCWLEPLYPEFQFWHGYRVDTLQPTLTWTSFPRQIDRQKLDPDVLRKIENVTYDLRIWDETVEVRSRPLSDRWRNGIFYERTGLVAPKHKLEVQLAPDSRYYWSVRARFVVDGRSMATLWARRIGCFSDKLFLGYYEFDTPK